jgi:hypothetical protein
MAALLCAVFLAYLPGLGGGFVFDDFPNIVNNTALHVRPGSAQGWLGAALASPAHNLPRPLAMFSFAVNHWFTGLDPVPLKLSNIGIHLLNVLLVFALARRLLRFHLARRSGEFSPEILALLVAALWGLHPMNLMGVLFIVQRMESLSHVFVFAGLWLYVSARCSQLEGREGRWPLLLLGLVGCTAAGMLAKESAALLPLYALLLEVFLFRFRSGVEGERERRLSWLFALVLVLPMLAGGAWQTLAALDPGAYAGREFTLGERLLTEPRVLMYYLRWILVPDIGQMALYHDDIAVSHGLLDPPTTLLALLALPALALLAWRIRTRWPLAGLGLSWFLAAHLLTATVIPLELVFEHRNYFALLGVCLVAAQALLALAHGPRAWLVPAVGFSAALALAGLTFLRANEWRDPMSFAVAEAAKHPQSPRASYYLAWMLITRSGYVADSEMVRQSFEQLERARRVPGAGVLPDQAALVLAARTGRAQDPAWWRHMQERLRNHPIGPQETGALAALVSCEIEDLCEFPQEQMVATFGAALARGDHPEVLNNYGNYALNEMQDPGLALRAWSEAARLNPGEPQYRISLVKLQVALRRDAEARAGIATLRAMGVPGQYEAQARELEERLAARPR